MNAVSILIVLFIVLFTMGTTYLVCKYWIFLNEDEEMKERLDRLKYSRPNIQHLDIFRGRHKTLWEIIIEKFKGF
jgi:hypothetical protein